MRVKPADYYVVWDSKKERFLAIINDHTKRTPKTIKGMKVHIAGYFKRPSFAIDYANDMLANGRIKL